MSVPHQVGMNTVDEFKHLCVQHLHNNYNYLGSSVCWDSVVSTDW